MANSKAIGFFCAFIVLSLMGLPWVACFFFVPVAMDASNEQRTSFGLALFGSLFVLITSITVIFLPVAMLYTIGFSIYGIVLASKK